MQLEHLLTAIVGAMCVYLLGQAVVRWFRSLPVPSDPWDALLSLWQKKPPELPTHTPSDHGMKKLLTAKDWTGIDVSLLKGLLEDEGIPCMIKNENLMVAIGELPPVECYQELWLLDADDYPRAKEICEAWHTATPLLTEVAAG